MATTPGQSPRLLLDTNVVIAHENDGPEPHIHAGPADTLVKLARSLGFELLLSSGTRSDFTDAPAALKQRRLRTLEKYYRTLDRVPENLAVRSEFPPHLSRNDAADLEVLSTFATGLPSVLVTEDVAMKRRAIRAGLSNVFNIDAAISWLRELKDPTLDNAASAEMVPAYQVDVQAALFQSLKEDYAFAEWWTSKVVREERPVIILGQAANPDGVAVLKTESHPFGLGERVLKICTFKVRDADDAGAGRRGELLLRAVVDYARDRGHPIAYLTAWSHHEKLLAWLTRFGFFHHLTNDAGERVMVKQLVPPPGAEPLSPLEHAIAYGPRALKVHDAHIVPIKYYFHDRLLPDSGDQPTLLENEPCGNAIRKAYLCRAPSRLLRPGHLLAFLRTEPRFEARVTAVGVVEQTLASSEPSEVATFVRGRTVYTYREIEQMCAKGEVLAVLFRLDTRISPAWSASSLKSARVMTSSPQSIARVPEEGVRWIRTKLDA